MNTSLANIMNGIMSSPYIGIIGIFFIVILLAFIAIYIGKKYGITFVTISQKIVVFIREALSSFNIGNAQTDLAINLILKTVDYILNIITTNDINTRTDSAIEYLKQLVKELDPKNTLTDAEINIIAEVLKMVFIFLSTFTINVGMLKYEKMVKVNDKIKLKLAKAEK